MPLWLNTLIYRKGIAFLRIISKLFNSRLILLRSHSKHISYEFLSESHICKSWNYDLKIKQISTSTYWWDLHSCPDTGSSSKATVSRHYQSFTTQTLRPLLLSTEKPVQSSDHMTVPVDAIVLQLANRSTLCEFFFYLPRQCTAINPGEKGCQFVHASKPQDLSRSDSMKTRIYQVVVSQSFRDHRRQS